MVVVGDRGAENRKVVIGSAGRSVAYYNHDDAPKPEDDVRKAMDWLKVAAVLHRTGIEEEGEGKS